jgi:hypothetical protein
MITSVLLRSLSSGRTGPMGLWSVRHPS